MIRLRTVHVVRPSGLWAHVERLHLLGWLWTWRTRRCLNWRNCHRLLGLLALALSLALLSHGGETVALTGICLERDLEWQLGDLDRVGAICSIRYRSLAYGERRATGAHIVPKGQDSCWATWKIMVIYKHLSTEDLGQKECSS